jgi:hypothetical protein
MASDRKPWGRLAASGLATAALYAALFLNEREAMASFTRTDGWFPLLPILAAFVFSFSHGAFTAYFWDALGVKPKPKAQEMADEAED